MSESIELARARRKRYRDAHRDAICESERQSKKRLRAAALALLGNTCKRCGFSDERALQIDHINGGGRKEARAIGGSDGICRKILRMEHPEYEYQVLCCNCNWIKRAENGEVK